MPLLRTPLESRNQHRDRFNENDEAIQTLLEEKHATFRDLFRDNTPQTRSKYQQARNNSQCELRRMKNQWGLEQVKEIEDLAERHDSKSFFKAIWESYLLGSY